ncbi:hypothetical protein CHARACLAT_015196 [Characodon lateralis]|uniref:Uncharacterized protein n=1 Tax=Characodon lateralis TaxID=208331 RepID=A0ABU7EBP4_9TELE|nr:hypothetical protein [Characodon lateralis]
MSVCALSLLPASQRSPGGRERFLGKGVPFIQPVASCVVDEEEEEEQTCSPEAPSALERSRGRKESTFRKHELQ